LQTNEIAIRVQSVLFGDHAESEIGGGPKLPMAMRLPLRSRTERISFFTVRK